MSFSHQHVSYDIFASKGRFLGSNSFFTFYALLLMILTTSSFYQFFGGSHVDGGSKTLATDSKLYLGMWFSLYGITGLSILMTFAQQGVRSSFFLVTPLLLWVFLSFMWSVSSDRTLYFGVMFIMQILMAYVVVENMKPDKFLRLLLYLFSFLLVLSIVGFYVMPEQTSLARFGGGWLVDMEMNGVFSHKSDAGYFFAVLIVALIGAKDIGVRWSFVVRAGFIVLAAIGILLANSATALLSALMLALVYLFLPSFTNKARVLTVIGIMILLFALLVPYIDIGQFAELIGRDRGLTGRDVIWTQGLEFIDNRLFLGYGYYGFFDENIFSPVWKLWSNFSYFLTPHFHNSGMDVSISLGIIGLAMYVLILLRAFMVLYNRTIMGSVRVLLFLILVLFIMTSSFDFTLMKHNHFATFFMFYVFFLSFKDYGEKENQ